VFLLFLSFLVVAIVFDSICCFLLRSERLLGGFFLITPFLRAPLAMIFPGVENHFQPWQHFLERGQPASRTGIALRTCFPSNTGFSGNAGLSGQPRFALNASLALRTGLAAFPLRTRLADGTDFAARTVWTGSSGMALRTGPAARTLWTGRPLALCAGCFVSHCVTPSQICPPI
jgi:hypothetical protein